MSLACILACSTGLTSAPPVAVLALQDPAAATQVMRPIRLDVSATVNGSPVGDVAVETDTTGVASAEVAQLLALLEPVVSPSTLEALRARASGAQFVALSELKDTGIVIAFDMASLRLNIVVPIEAMTVNQLTIVDRSQFRRAGLTEPEDFSAGITFSIGQRLRHSSGFGRLDREHFDIVADGFLNFGGIDGVNLAFQGGYREDGELVRRRTTLFHDDVNRAIRYSAGDLEPQAFGSYDAPVDVLGVGVERLYSTIQPFRNLRPAGRGSLIIERPSRVDVLVNGTIYRSLDLAPGQYDIRDFPSLNGLNDVQLVVREENGRTETINLSFFSDIDLIDADVSIFSATIGLRRNRFGEFVNTAYEESPVFSGFYLRGVTDRLTVGGALQLDKDNAMISGQAVVATSIGIIGLETAFDLSDVEPTQTAVTISYRMSSASSGNRSSGFNLDLQYRSARFSPMERSVGQQNRFSWDLNARYQFPIGRDSYVSATAGYSWSRYSLPDVWTIGMSANRRIGRITANVNYSYRHDERGTDHRGLFSLSLPLGPRQSVRASYDTRDNRISSDYQMIGFEGLGQTDVRVGGVRADNGEAFNLDVEHHSNRFRAAVRHNYDRFDGATQHTTDLAASFGIGYAGGKIAIGRDAARGFAIVDRHKTLRDAGVVVSDSFSIGPSAKTGALGPALVPVRRAYQPSTMKIDVADLPVGYDIGPGRYDIAPGAASGYSITIGSAASNTVLGRLIDSDGKPMAFATGTLEPLSGEEAQPVQFFTNRTGRMAVLKVAPGRYRVILSGQSKSIGEVTVPEEAEGLVDVGELRDGVSR